MYRSVVEEVPPFAFKLVMGLFYGIVFLSFANFNPAVIWMGPDEPVDPTPEQQIAIAVCWLLLIGCTLFPRVLRVPGKVNGMSLPMLYLVYIVVSPLWSYNLVNAAPKAVVFLIVAIGMWRLASIISCEKVLDVLFWVLLSHMLLSTVIIAFRPNVGIVADWQHAGLWRGIYQTKGNLGECAAPFIYLAIMRLCDRRNWFNLLATVFGLTLLIGSGSRDSIAVSVIGPLAVLIVRRYPSSLTAIVNIMFAEIWIALAAITYFVYTGADDFDLGGGTHVDFTERTFIWHYAIDAWTSRPFFGYGINGFWTDLQVLWDFERVHRWVLDNYHNGYLTILNETGVIGMVMFIGIVSQLCFRMRWLIMLATPSSRIILEKVLGLLILIFTLNLLETTFLRSTNIYQGLFTFFLIKILSEPIWAVEHLPQSPPSLRIATE
jgi:O-antigen ligase